MSFDLLRDSTLKIDSKVTLNIETWILMPCPRCEDFIDFFDKETFTKEMGNIQVTLQSKWFIFIKLLKDMTFAKKGRFFIKFKFLDQSTLPF